MTGSIQDRIGNICEIKMSQAGSESGDEHVNGMDDNRFAKIAKNEKPNVSKLPKTKLGHQYYRNTHNSHTG